MHKYIYINLEQNMYIYAHDIHIYDISDIIYLNIYHISK